MHCTITMLPKSIHKKIARLFGITAFVTEPCTRKYVIELQKKNTGINPLEGGQVLHYILNSLSITLLAKKVSERR
jgi:hypothetical protein